MDITSLSQGDLSVTKYFIELHIIRDERDNFLLDPICTCQAKCTCKIPSIIIKRKQEDQAMQFLHGLNDQYDNVRSHVILMEHISPITKIPLWHNKNLNWPITF